MGVGGLGDGCVVDWVYSFILLSAHVEVDSSRRDYTLLMQR